MMESTGVALDPGHDPSAADRSSSLFEPAEQEDLRNEWVRVQAQFVDDPTLAVEAADALVGRVLQSVEAALAADRLLVQKRQMGTEGPSTDELRTTIRSYRTFFERLLAV